VSPEHPAFPELSTQHPNRLEHHTHLCGGNSRRLLLPQTCQRTTEGKLRGSSRAPTIARLRAGSRRSALNSPTRRSTHNLLTRTGHLADVVQAIGEARLACAPSISGRD
ncbi:hypothetical protein CSHISOI_04443, partial [Colletotrichum shisoi]